MLKEEVRSTIGRELGSLTEKYELADNVLLEIL